MAEIGDKNAKNTRLYAKSNSGIRPDTGRRQNCRGGLGRQGQPCAFKGTFYAETLYRH